jgi:hypothetical protein
MHGDYVAQPHARNLILCDESRNLWWHACSSLSADYSQLDTCSLMVPDIAGQVENPCRAYLYFTTRTSPRSSDAARRGLGPRRRPAAQARREMRETGATPIPWEQVKADLGLA